MSVESSVLFLQQLRDGFDTIGAVWPTSAAAARTLTAEVARHKGPKRILEVGCGTGAITEELVKHLGPRDKLVVCDTNDTFIEHLQDRFELEPQLKQAKRQVTVMVQNVLDLPAEPKFDFIVSTVPFTSFGPETCKAIWAKYQELLAPGGVVSYFEYMYIRGLKRQLLERGNTDLQESSDFLDQLIEEYQFRRETIGANVPPVWIRNLRFDEVEPRRVETLEPMDRRRLRLGPFSMAKDGLPMVAGLGALSLVMKKKKWKGWGLPLMLAGAAAWFHRDPERDIEVRPEEVLAPADGRVLGVERIRHPRLGDIEWTRINIFLSIADVHINRAPVGGTVVDRWDEPGNYSPAYQDESQDNESRYVVFEGARGRVGVAQRSGVLARKIKTWVDKGELLVQGERFGLIHFGSRTDLYLPADQVNVLVQAGDRVIAGQTPVARYLPHPQGDEGEPS